MGDVLVQKERERHYFLGHLIRPFVDTVHLSPGCLAIDNLREKVSGDKPVVFQHPVEALTDVGYQKLRSSGIGLVNHFVEKDFLLASLGKRAINEDGVFGFIAFADEEPLAAFAAYWFGGGFHSPVLAINFDRHQPSPFRSCIYRKQSIPPRRSPLPGAKFFPRLRSLPD